MDCCRQEITDLRRRVQALEQRGRLDALTEAVRYNKTEEAVDELERDVERHLLQPAAGPWHLIQPAAGSWVEGFPPGVGIFLVRGSELDPAVAYVHRLPTMRRFAVINGVRMDSGTSNITHHARIHPPKTEATDEKS